MVLQIDKLPGAMLRIDPAGFIQELNDAGRQTDRVLRTGRNLFDWLDASARAELAAHLGANRSSANTSGEFEVCISNRRYRLAVAGQACPDESRMVQITDITDYRALSERVTLNEQRYRSLFSQNPDAVCSLDMHGCLAETNLGIEHLTGLTRAELRHARWESLVDEADRESARTSFKAAASGCPCSYRCKVKSRRDGKSVVEMTYIPILVEGQVTGVFGVARDKTEFYRLEENRRLLQACADQVQDVIVITETGQLDEPGPRIIYVNEAITPMTGYQPKEMLGRSPRMLQGPDTDRAALDRIRKALENGDAIKEVVVNYCKDGQPFWNEVEIVPIPATLTGGRAYFASVQRDITQAKQREADLHRSREDLRRLSRAQEGMLEQERRRIARDLHDELGQTLTALKLSLGVAVNDLQEPLPEHVSRLQKLLGLVDGAVDKVSDIAANLRPAMLDDLGFEAAAEWFLNECAGREKLDIQWRPQNTGGSRVHGETATALFRILQECMTNISRHARAASVVIDYRESDESAVLEIRDDGVGFDPGQVRRSGFGLMGIRERVAMLHGDLTVESALGKGVRIRVCLPLESDNRD